MAETLLWRSAGRVYLWRYEPSQRGYEGWHVTADAAGCRDLVDACLRIEASAYSCQLDVPTFAPSAEILAVPNANEAVVFPRSWEFRVSPKMPVGHWSMTSTDRNTVSRLECSRDQVQKLRAGFEGIVRGDGDYSIGGQAARATPDAERLWFWWMPGNSPPGRHPR